MREPSLVTLFSLIRLNKVTETKPNTALRPQGARRISSLRAFRRARDSERTGRVDWKWSPWFDAKFEVTSSQSSLRNEQPPVKRDERVEGRKSLVPEGRDGTEKGRPLRQRRAERREKSAERSEKRKTNTIKMRGSKVAMVR